MTSMAAGAWAPYQPAVLPPHPINAVVVRQWQGKDYGPGGKTVLLTNAPVEKPLPVFDDDDDRSLSENCCIKEAKQQWDLGYPPQKTERAVRVHVVLTLLVFARSSTPCPRSLSRLRSWTTSVR
jgi:hypothetical protein